MPDTCLPLAPSTFADGLALPKIIVFDLDWTLWPYYFDNEPIKLPLRSSTSVLRTYSVQDSSDPPLQFSLFPDVVPILLATRKASVLLGIASRSSDAELSMSFLRLVNLPSTDGAPETALDLFDKRYIHIESTNPASKVVHLRRIKAAARGKLRFGDMLFFDDDYRNWKAVERLGASFHLLGPEKSKAGSTKVPLTVTVVDEGVRRWREKTKKGKGKKSGPKVKEKQKSTAKKKVNKKSEAKKKGNRKLTAKWTGCIVS